MRTATPLAASRESTGASPAPLSAGRRKRLSRPLADWRTRDCHRPSPDPHPPPAPRDAPGPAALPGADPPARAPSIAARLVPRPGRADRQPADGAGRGGHCFESGPVDVIERTATELLTEAREFIAEPERWCQGYLALDGHGKRIQPGLVTNVARCCGLGAAELAAARHGLVESWLELT